MTRRSMTHRALGTAAAVAILVAPTAAFAKDDSKADDQTRTIRQREILISDTDEPHQKGSWITQNIHLHEQSGFSYKQNLKMGDRPVRFRVRGPVMRKQKALGLVFKFDF